MSKTLQKLLFSVVFCAYLLIGVFVHADYGVSWDEPISRTNGLVNLKYIESRVAPGLLRGEVEQAPDLATWKDRDYGVAFELPLVALEQVFGVTGESVYPFRHLMTFLFCSLGVLALYLTGAFVYRDRRAGLLAALLLILAPRLFAESFYNSKDMVFMAAVAVAIYTMTRLVTRPRWRWAIAHGIATAVAIDVRIMGVILAAATLGILVVRAMKGELRWRLVWVSLATYLATAAAVIVALFPFLWESPAKNFAFAFSNMASFRWPQNVLYLGNLYPATALPWHYLPVWILLTTPVVFSVLMVLGGIRGARTLVENRLALWRDERQMAELAYIALLLGPLLVIISIQAVVYDGWRHVYFVYPAFVLVAVSGFVALLEAIGERAWMGRAAILVLALTFASNAYWIARAHPLQNVYFNALAGKHWKDRFDLDYWGMGNRAAFQYVLDHSDGRAFTIKAISLTPMDRPLLTMSAAEKARITLSPSSSRTDFVLTNYRLESQCEGVCDIDGYTLFYQKKVADEPVVTVFRIDDESRVDRVTTTNRPYTEDEFRHLSYRLANVHMSDGRTYVDLVISNAGSTVFSAASSVGSRIRISWRFVDRGGRAVSGWDNRMDLPHDIPAHATTIIPIAVATVEGMDPGALEASLVQEGVFWAHDIGITPASVAWPGVR